MSQPPPDAAFAEYLAGGELRLQRCGGCAQAVFYPRVLCPRCGSQDLAWVAATGSGTVYSTTTVRRPPERGGDYDLSIVELDEGPRLMTRVEGVAPDQVRIGMGVTAVVRAGGEEPELVFVPAPEQP